MYDVNDMFFVVWNSRGNALLYTPPVVGLNYRGPSVLPDLDYEKAFANKHG